MSIIVHTKGKKFSNVIIQMAIKLEKKIVPDELKVSASKEQIIELIKDDIKIDNFIGGFEVDKSVLEKEVPESFLNNQILDDENNLIGRKLWKDYCSYKINFENTKVLLIIGYVNSNNNRNDIVMNDELLKWINCFGIKNILTKSEMKTLIINDYTLDKDLNII